MGGRVFRDVLLAEPHQLAHKNLLLGGIPIWGESILWRKLLAKGAIFQACTRLDSLACCAQFFLAAAASSAAGCGRVVRKALVGLLVCLSPPIHTDVQLKVEVFEPRTEGHMCVFFRRSTAHFPGVPPLL